MISQNDAQDVAIYADGRSQFLNWAYDSVDGSLDRFGVYNYNKHLDKGSTSVAFVPASTTTTASGQTAPPTTTTVPPTAVPLPQRAPDATADGVSIWWAMSGGSITFTYSSSVTGWLSIGLATSFFMSNLDVGHMQEK